MITIISIFTKSDRNIKSSETFFFLLESKCMDVQKRCFSGNTMRIDTKLFFKAKAAAAAERRHAN